MRARNIKPGFYTDEDLVECSMAARLLAPALWMMADKKGRLEYRPKRIKIQVFPVDDVNIEALITELESCEHIIRYQVDGCDYIYIPGFKQHQNPHKNEKESEIPRYINEPEDKVESLPVESSNYASDPADSLIPDSHILIPENTSPLRFDVLDASATPTEPKNLKKEKNKRGTRLSPDWRLPDDWGEWAEREFNLTVQQVIGQAEKFRDHWLAKAGPQGVKLDWEATWRNWVRTYIEGFKK